MTPENLPLEDMVMKQGIQYFGDVLLPFLGINEPVTAVMPTEQIYMEVRRLNEDYNFAQNDGSWLHLEFESDSVKTEDLRRFRGYEAVASYTYHVPITTCVICSSTGKEIMSQLDEGINIYRVEIIHLKGWDADHLFENLFRIKGAVGLTKDESLSMQAVLYALANKFLDDEDLRQVKEVMSMTRLGKMLLLDGIEQGIEQGIQAMVSTLQELGFSHEAVRNKITKF